MRQLSYGGLWRSNAAERRTNLIIVDLVGQFGENLFAMMPNQHVQEVVGPSEGFA